MLIERGKMINLYCGDCLEMIPKLDEPSDLILTSPPYNMTKRKGGFSDKKYRYDVYRDDKTYKEYLEWTIKVFKSFDKILKKNGLILYNFSYSVENPVFPYLVISEIYNNTNFTLADTIIWKKQSSMPYPASPNRAQRIFEFVFVIVRKTEIKTFKTNKTVSKISPNGQKYYNPIFNFVEAKNNDGKSELNEATFSTELVIKLLKMYAKKDKNFKVLDPFSGTGTTMNACELYGCSGVGIELSLQQVKFSEERINNKANLFFD